MQKSSPGLIKNLISQVGWVSRVSSIIFICLMGLSACGGFEQEAKTPAPVTNISALSSPKYVVQPGDTIEEVSDGFGVTIGQLALWNHLSPPYLLKTGQVLWVRPPMAQASVNSSTLDETPMMASMEPGIVMPKTEPKKNIISSKSHPPAVVTKKQMHQDIAAPVVQPPAVPPVSASGWSWPMVGRVSESSSLGGIDIHVDRQKTGRYIKAIPDAVMSNGHKNNDQTSVYAGVHVFAAKAGKVVYVGPDLNDASKQMVILDNSNGWLSAYGNLESVRIGLKENTNISRLEYLGDVKNVLHFDIRQNGTSVSPETYLPELSQALTTAHRNDKKNIKNQYV